ncbi:hypothetical protein CPter91_5402 [Collimonas pratensis]|uniref:Uncharacterized protein n=1 Tax=Collimonas pratensis TaxID=279113 RepID=A0A127QCA0_9BURK|nr:hypothetical protein CPter91_5402 [Collimonas pratensis]
MRQKFFNFMEKHMKLVNRMKLKSKVAMLNVQTIGTDEE